MLHQPEVAWTELQDSSHSAKAGLPSTAHGPDWHACSTCFSRYLSFKYCFMTFTYKPSFLKRAACTTLNSLQLTVLGRQTLLLSCPIYTVPVQSFTTVTSLLSSLVCQALVLTQNHLKLIKRLLFTLCTQILNFNNQNYINSSPVIEGLHRYNTK